MANKKNLSQTLNDLGIKAKKITLGSLLVESGISEAAEEELEEDLIEPTQEEPEFVLPEIPTGEPEIDPLVVQGLETADDAFKKEEEERPIVDKFIYETEWFEKYDFASQNLGIIDHGLNAGLDKLVIKTSLRITDPLGSIVDEGPILDQIHLYENKQYGIGFIPLDENHVKILTAKDGVIWSSSSGEGLDLRLIENIESSIGKVEYKITFHKMISDLSKQLLEDIEKGKNAPSSGGLAIYSGPAGVPGPPGAPGPSGVTDVQDKNILYVRAKGNDSGNDGSITFPYKTIKAAIASIVAPSRANSFIVDVGPGEFTEDNSAGAIGIPSSTTLKGQFKNISHITGSDVSKALFYLNDHCGLDNVTLYGITSNSAIVADQADSMSTLKDIEIEDCQNGIETNNITAVVDIYNITALGTITNLFKVGPGRVRARSIVIRSNTTVETIFRVNGSGANLHTWGTISYSPSVTNGVYVTNNGISHNVNTEINNANYGLRVATGGYAYGSSFFLDSTIWNIWQEDSTGIVELDSGSFEGKKIKAADWSKINISYINLTVGNEGQNISQELHVGVPEKGNSTSLGEGPPISRGMLIYNYNGSTYTDVTTEASDPTTGTFTLGTSLNNAIYISSDLKDLTTSDYTKFLGVHLNITQAFNLGAGSMVWEYWDGSSWTPFTVMRSQALYPYLPFSNKDPILLGDGQFQIRFNIELIKSGTGSWSKNDPPSTGTNRHWVRYRVSSGITQGIIVQQIKLHTNTAKFHEDGWLTFFGTARPVSVLFWDAGLFQPFGGSTPADQDLFISDNLGVGRIENLFANGASDRVGLTSNLPLDCDVSCPIVFQWSWVASTNSANTINWIIRYGYSTDGDSIHFTTGAAPTTGPNELAIPLNVTNTTAEVQVTSSVFLNISNTVSRRSGGIGDTLWAVIERDGGGDTYAGNVALINVTAKYFKWCDGGHIDLLMSV
jgi:hypothetical protein